MLLACYLGIMNWPELVQSSENVFSGTSLVLLVGITGLLKVVHEFGHAICCKRYGGDVGEMGVLMILLAPLAYVDVSSTWRFRSRWHRIHVALAGIYVELVIASLAMLVWTWTDGELLRHLCVSTMLSASAMTLLFNANPLMKFDGYFVLTDWSRTPNLYSDSQKHLGRLARRVFFGATTGQPDWSPAYRRFVFGYGMLAWLWKWFVCIGLVAAAAKLFHGLGIVLAIAACVLWIGIPLHRIRQAFAKSTTVQKRRFLTVTSTVLLVTTTILCVVPWPGSGTVPAVVEYSPHDIIRAEVEGFVQSLHVRPGQRVTAGQALLTLHHPDLELSVRQLETQIEQAKIRRRQHSISGQHSGAQAEETELRSLENQRRELRKQLAQLTVRSPRSGIVIRRRLADLEGAFISAGDELVVVGRRIPKGAAGFDSASSI